MFVETWYKTWCPGCKKVNWFCAGDLTDMTAPDLEACECHACGKIYLLDDNDPLDYFSHRLSEEEEGVITTIEQLVAAGHVYTEKGRPTP